MAKVKFIDVGRNKMTWEADIRRPTEGALIRAVKASGALRSSDVGCAEGIIFAGFHTVGRYEIEPSKPSRKPTVVSPDAEGGK